MQQRESLGSRLGFILLSAGCAIGIGNVWRFPYVAGSNGGGVFVLLYLVFLILMGVPVLSMEFAIGRASQKSIVCAYPELQKQGQKWHYHGVLAMVGNYILMMYYTTVAGWMIYYFYRYLTGAFTGLDQEGITMAFNQLMAQPATLVFWTLLIIIVGFAVCSLGLQNGVERITKVMMIALLGLIILLAIHSLTLEGGMEGLKFYLLPDFKRASEVGIVNILVAAMNQAFFTLSIGIGSMMIFGSYLKKDKRLLGESINVALLDTFVAIMAGLIIFPACFSFGVEPNSGPPLIFMTLPNVFNSMLGGRIWGTLFFLFMTFASLSTVIAVFENILCCCMDKFHWDRKKACLLNCLIVGIGSLPCALGFNLLSGVQLLGEGSTILDFEDFLVSNLLLPGGSLIILLFCTSKWGWGFKNFLKEVNQGEGMKFPQWLRPYLTYVLPILLITILLQGLYAVFF